MLTGGLANTSFIGLPMIEAFYGPQFLGLGILIDQLGSYFVLSTLGILVASLYSSGHGINGRVVIRKIVLFVPFQAFILALLLAVRIPLSGSTNCSSAWALLWSRLLSYRSATSCSSATYGARCSKLVVGPASHSPPLRGYAARARADAQRDRIRGGDGPNDRGKHRGDGS